MKFASLGCNIKCSNNLALGNFFQQLFIELVKKVILVQFYLLFTLFLIQNGLKQLRKALPEQVII